MPGGGRPHPLQVGRAHRALFESGDEACQRALLTREDALERGRLCGEVDVALGDEPVDHAGQAQPLAVLGAEDVHPTLAEELDLRRDDDSPAAAVDPDVSGPRSRRRSTR